MDKINSMEEANENYVGNNIHPENDDLEERQIAWDKLINPKQPEPIEDKELFEWVKARIDYLKSIKLTEFGEGTLSAYELVYEWLKPVKAALQQKGNNESDAVEFAEWIYKNAYNQFQPGKFRKRKELVRFTTEELYKLFKQSKL